MARPNVPTAFTPPSTIKIDELNPRQAPQSSQEEAIKMLIKGQGKKIVALAKDINAIGLSAAERFMVIADGKGKTKSKTYISLDGNRRLLALKLLADPTLAEGVLSKAHETAIKAEAEKYASSPITEVEVAIYPSREDGTPWVARRHGRNMNGVGQDSWGAEEGAHFDAWRNQNRGRADLQILLFVRNHGKLTAAETQQLAKFPITNLRRIVTNDATKMKFGYETVKGDVFTSYSDEEFVKPFKKMLLDMSNPVKKDRIKVTALEDKKLRQAYLDTFTEADLPKKPLVVWHRLGEKNEALPVEDEPQEDKPSAGDKPAGGEDSKPQDAENPKEDENDGKPDGENLKDGEKGDKPEVDDKPVSGGKDTKKSKSPKPTTTERIYIIPDDCILNIDNVKIRDIYDELQKRLVSNVTRNACAVLLRVFIELSVDAYIKKHPADIKPRGSKTNSSTLGDKLWAVAEYAAKNLLITATEANAVYDGTKEENILAPRVKTMHAYVHSDAASPLALDLRAHWNNMQPLMQAIWS